MTTRVGQIAALFRYPVKSMRGERLDVVTAGWHGLHGDRRLGLRRINDRGGFPWLTASKLPALLCFAPERQETSSAGAGELPTHVRTPGGDALPLFGPDLAEDIGRRHGAPVEMVYLDRGIFDEASVSLITSATVDALGQLAALPADVRRYRPNVLVATSRSLPFEEDDWVGGVLSFGEAADAAAVYVTNRDVRCSMVNYDPDSAVATPELLRCIARGRGNTAGVYATVVRRGTLTIGQPILFTREGA
jgi:uncharacterized protein YcbX